MAKRKGAPPGGSDQPAPAPLDGISDGGYPVLSLRHLQQGWGMDELDPEHCKQFLVKWHKRSAHTWTELIQHPKHGLGSEQLTRKTFKPWKVLPERLHRDTYMVFRHAGNRPFAGFRIGDVFYVLWIEGEFGDLYGH
jgi:hypothetical protein